MKRSKPMVKKAFSVLISFVLAVSFAFPTAAFAAQPEVEVENHTVASAQTVSDITIDGVDAPQPGQPLDDKAQVNTAEGETWDIPVLWIGDDLQLATEAAQARTYLPALAFYVPQGLSIEGGTFTATLSDSLTKLFGDADVISVYDARTGITYILPASLRDFFTHAIPVAEEASQPAASKKSEPAAETPAASLVDIYCAQTARDVLSDDELEWLIDLILHKLEPQAVELLLDSFPAFRTAADQGQIGTQIGLYIYYKNGDKDGKREHESAQSALAYVSGDVVKMDGSFKYCYMIGVDVDDLLVKDEDGFPVSDSTGKFKLVRSGEHFDTFNNTIVHELFHAVMDDYNRTGMAGGVNPQDVYAPSGTLDDQRQIDLYNAYLFPFWFIEGTASAVENVYTFRYDTFQMLRVKEDGTGYEDSFTSQSLLWNYLNAESSAGPMNFDLAYAYDTENNTTSRYVTGYLACLYLAQLAGETFPSIGSSLNKTDTGEVIVVSDNLRLGLNWILESLHNGKTLDQVINEISPRDSKGKPIYADTDGFENLFIKGPKASDETYFGDKPSSDFTMYLLNYLLSLEVTGDNPFRPNGSILFAFDKDFAAPLDPDKESSSKYLKIIESNELVESTVLPTGIEIGAGKSVPSETDEAATETELPLAAKAGAEAAPVAGAASEPVADGAAGETEAAADAAQEGALPAGDGEADVNAEDVAAGEAAAVPEVAVPADEAAPAAEVAAPADVAAPVVEPAPAAEPAPAEVVATSDDAAAADTEVATKETDLEAAA